MTDTSTELEKKLQVQGKVTDKNFEHITGDSGALALDCFGVPDSSKSAPVKTEEDEDALLLEEDELLLLDEEDLRLKKKTFFWRQRSFFSWTKKIFVLRVDACPPHLGAG